MKRNELVKQIAEKRSVLCVGLDTDLKKIPKHFLKEEDPGLAFNKAVIDATKEFAVAYKINTAFYEAQGIKGWESMEKTLRYIPEGIFTIADAKRGDLDPGAADTQYSMPEILMPNVADPVMAYMDKSGIEKMIARTEKEMMRAAKAMEFMEAARLRDELEVLRNRLKEL